MIAPAITSMAKPATPSWAFDRIFGAARVARSRPAKPSVPATASSAIASNPAEPGRRIISTPTKPTATAVHRRQPTGSPKTSAAPATTTSGVACRIAEAADSGISASASP